MDAVADKIALIFAGDEPFEILATPTAPSRFPPAPGRSGLRSRGVQADRRDDLGTTHHDAGTMRMGDNIADAVTNDFRPHPRYHELLCRRPGPLPALGSPNPMLTGVALGRRTGDLLNGRRCCPLTRALGPAVISPQDDTGFRPLFDGTAATFKNWSLAGPAGGGMLHLNGEMVSYGEGRCGCSITPRDLRRFYVAPAVPDFRRREPQQRRVHPLPAPDARPHRCPRSAYLAARAEPFDAGNPAWRPVIAGFEVQIDDNARGDSGKDFYGIKPEPDGLFKNRTGAIYKIQAGDRVWHLNFNEPAVQNYTPGPALVPGVWFEYEIAVQGNDYTVFLTNTQTGVRQQTTSFQNTDGERGRYPGFIGVQAYPGSTVAWRHIRIKTP